MIRTSLAIALLYGFTHSPALHAQQGAPAQGTWPHYAAGPGATKYSPLDQITPSNVGDLEPAWTWVSTDAEIQRDHSDNRTIATATYFECTPLMIDGVLYVTTCLGQVTALDAGTGDIVWNFNPGAWQAGRPPNLGYISRGCAYRAEGETRRIYHASPDSWLYALDADTGKPDPAFGVDGRTDLTDGIPRATHGPGYGHPSAPVIVGDVVVVGSSISDGAPRIEGIPGQIQAYDVHTGQRRWTFNLVPHTGDLGADTWPEGISNVYGGANAWTGLTVDDSLGYVYVPTSTPSNDFYGGHRAGDNLFAESIVCIDAATGERVWHYQTVRHGLWDYDNPAPPVLLDITVDEQSIPALALVTKQGFTFVFDRRDGTPVFPIEERPVPASDVPGEVTAATQPFPVKPPPFTLQGAVEENLNDLTPEVHARAKEKLTEYRHGPLFTPPALGQTLITMPGYGGGANWAGAAADPESGLLYVPAMNHPSIISINEADPARSNFRYTRGRGAEFPTVDGLPIFKPPWATISAINLNEGTIEWQVPNGGPGPIDHPLIKHLNLDYLGTNARAACIVTKTLLIVTEGSGRSGSATGGGPGLRFLDKATGRELFRYELPAEATGVPMTYRHEGRQFIAVAVGTTPARLVALALPR